MVGISQFEKVLSFLYQRKRECRLVIMLLRRRKISPMEAAQKLFGEEIVPEGKLLCFFLMLRQRNGLAIRVVTDLKKKKGASGKIDVYEASFIMEDEMEERCRALRSETMMELQKIVHRRIRFVRNGRSKEAA